MKINTKQQRLLSAVGSGKYNVIFLIGALGTSKTFGMALTHCQIAFQYPGTLQAVGRFDLSEARESTYESYLEALDEMKLVEGHHFTAIASPKPLIRFANKSRIVFVPLNHTKDRQWNKLKGVNASSVGIDEVDSVKQLGYTALMSRKGRQKTGAPSTMICTCNPNDTWVKEHIYDPWRKGTLPKDTLVIDFEMHDSFLGTDYYDQYADQPEQWKQRYLFNNWDYQDDANALFKSRVLDRITVSEYEDGETSYAGLDVAREGKDRSVIARIVGDTLVDIEVYNREDIKRLAEPDQRDEPPWLNILADVYYNYCAKYEIGYEHASVDAVGNGGGVVDNLRTKKFMVNEFKAGSSPIKQAERKDQRKPDFSIDYDMLRSQMYHQLSRDMESGKFKLYDGCAYLSELKRELLYHQHTTESKVMKVEKKEQIKERLGKSPDIADAVVMAYFNKKRIRDRSQELYRIGM